MSCSFELVISGCRAHILVLVSFEVAVSQCRQYLFSMDQSNQLLQGALCYLVLFELLVSLCSLDELKKRVSSCSMHFITLLPFEVVLATGRMYFPRLVTFNVVVSGCRHSLFAAISCPLLFCGL